MNKVNKEGRTLDLKGNVESNGEAERAGKSQMLKPREKAQNSRKKNIWQDVCIVCLSAAGEKFSREIINILLGSVLVFFSSYNKLPQT